MKKESIEKWLRKEIEKLDNKKIYINKEIKKIIKNEDINSLNKINQYNIELRELNAVQNKLYEMIDRLYEIEN